MDNSPTFVGVVRRRPVLFLVRKRRRRGIAHRKPPLETPAFRRERRAAAFCGILRPNGPTACVLFGQPRRSARHPRSGRTRSLLHRKVAGADGAPVSTRATPRGECWAEPAPKR